MENYLILLEKEIDKIVDASKSSDQNVILFL